VTPFLKPGNLRRIWNEEDAFERVKKLESRELTSNMLRGFKRKHMPSLRNEIVSENGLKKVWDLTINGF